MGLQTEAVSLVDVFLTFCIDCCLSRQRPKRICGFNTGRIFLMGFLAPETYLDASEDAQSLLHASCCGEILVQ